MSSTKNLGRCPRCKRFLIEEETKTHQCDFRDIGLRGGKEIVLDHITDLGRDRNDDHVLLGWGLDAILYRLVECKHNPPHGTKRTAIMSNDKCPNDKPPRGNAIECLGEGGRSIDLRPSMRNHHHTSFSGAEWQPVSPAHPNTVDVCGNCGRFEGYIVTSTQLSGSNRDTRTKRLAQNTTTNRLGNLSTNTKPSDALGLVALRFILTRGTFHPYMKFEILPEPNLDSTIGQYRQLSSDRMACDIAKACSDFSDPLHVYRCSLCRHNEFRDAFAFT
jgi:hypothetical protein